MMDSAYARLESMRQMCNPLFIAALVLIGHMSPLQSIAQPLRPDTTTAQQLDLIVIDASRLEGTDGFDMPSSVSSRRLGDDNRTGILASEALDGMPGVMARDRGNFAQDTQLSIRGYGARSTFGIRGIRLYTDGIPATMPDGQGQLSHFSLPGGDRVEIIRGPFSALHGNASGGIVQLVSADGTPDDPWRIRASTGTNALNTITAQALGASEKFGYNVAMSHIETNGAREHSQARRESLNAKLRFNISDRRRLDVIANYLDLPDANDPLGLSAVEFRENPDQTTPAAMRFDTRKSVRQPQIGVVYEHGMNERQTLRAMVYAGHRDVEQYLSVPVAAQTNPLNAGGVIDLDNDYGGTDLRWSWLGALAEGSLEITVGTNLDRQRQHRRGFENFVGERLGVRGELRRDERNRVGNFDQFAQASWRFLPRWWLLAGARRSDLAFRSDDRYVTSENPDDSGRVDYSEVSPVLGLTFAPSDRTRLYLSAGRGFETPTFNELSYRTDGGAGLAFDLQPAISDSIEAGLKWRGRDDVGLDIALFRSDTKDELAVASNVAGRSSYRNVGHARRQGVEATWSASLGEHWHARIALNWLDATFRSGFFTCVSAGCATPTIHVPAGARIPGVAQQQAFARLQWQKRAWTAAMEIHAIGNVVVNDSATESAAGHALVNVELSRTWTQSHGELRGFARLDNALDRIHAGSVIVNEGNGRFYEPGPGRTWLAGIEWRWYP